MPNDRDAAPTVGSLFERSPFQFGLRGDPHAWGELAERLADTPLPTTVFDVKPLIERELDAVVGERVLLAREPIHVARFDRGSGMSAGFVDPEWWRRTGIPIIVDRYLAVGGSRPAE